MSARITVSYEHKEELEAIRRLLAPIIDRMSVYPHKEPYKKAYIWLNEPNETA